MGCGKGFPSRPTTVGKIYCSPRSVPFNLTHTKLGLVSMCGLVSSRTTVSCLLILTAQCSRAVYCSLNCSTDSPPIFRTLHGVYSLRNYVVSTRAQGFSVDNWLYFEFLRRNRANDYDSGHRWSCLHSACVVTPKRICTATAELLQRLLWWHLCRKQRYRHSSCCRSYYSSYPSSRITAL